MPLAVSDVVWQALIAAVVALILGWMQYRIRNAVEKGADRTRVVEEKLDANTATTNAVEAKADTIVSQTNGTATETHNLMEQLGALVRNTRDRVTRLEEYNRESSHRVLDAVQAMHLKVAELVAGQRGQAPAPPPPPAGDKP